MRAETYIENKIRSEGRTLTASSKFGWFNQVRKVINFAVESVEVHHHLCYKLSLKYVL